MPEAFHASFTEVGRRDDAHKAVFVRGAIGRLVLLGEPVDPNVSRIGSIDVKEEESEYRTTSGRWTGSASSSTSSDREQGQDEHKRNTHAKEGEGKESTGSAPTKKEKRFLLF